jgi:hypothetical protein
VRLNTSEDCRSADRGYASTGLALTAVRAGPVAPTTEPVLDPVATQATPWHGRTGPLPQPMQKFPYLLGRHPRHALKQTVRRIQLYNLGGGRALLDHARS